MQDKRTSVNLDADAMDVAMRRIEPADENSSSLLSAARFSGYHAAALENAIKPATKKIEEPYNFEMDLPNCEMAWG